MKKWIIATACILTFSGYAAAQNSSAKATSTTAASKTIKKGSEPVTPAKKGTTKKETTEPVVKLALPKFDANDPTAVPKPKEQ